MTLKLLPLRAADADNIDAFNPMKAQRGRVVSAQTFVFKRSSDASLDELILFRSVRSIGVRGNQRKGMLKRYSSEAAAQLWTT